MIDTSPLNHTFELNEFQRSPPPLKKQLNYRDLVHLINRSIFSEKYTPIIEAKKYKIKYQNELNKGMDSFDLDLINQAACSNRNIELISQPRFEGQKFIYFAEGKRDHQPYQITCDYTKSQNNPSISCEVLPFA